MKNRILILASCVIGLAGPAMADQVLNVSATAQGSDSVEITWDALPGVATYDVYENSITRIASGVSQTTYLRLGLEAATSYQYFVTGCDIDGVCGEASLQATVTTGVTNMDAGSDSAGITATYSDNGDGTALLEWSPVANAEGYNIFINNEYANTIFDSLSLIVAFAAGDELQVAWFGDGVYPAKSEVASLSMTAPIADSFAGLDSATAGSATDVEIYFTRHAEKKTELKELENGNFEEVCGDSKCSEVLSSAGELRAELLVGAFADAGITKRLTHAFSSHKTRTRQTIEAIVAAAGLTGDVDKNAGDGIQENPVMNDDGTANATELDPQSTSGSEQPTIDALIGLQAGSVALVAGHSGTLYDIMAGLGLTDVCRSDTVDTCNQERYPINAKAKVRDFGDIWKVVMQDGVATFAYRVNLQPRALQFNNATQ
ncbi:MAG: hypothetical protein V3U65_15350 [Granulosicoccaceae bacterium]